MPHPYTLVHYSPERQAPENRDCHQIAAKNRASPSLCLRPEYLFRFRYSMYTRLTGQPTEISSRRTRFSLGAAWMVESRRNSLAENGMCHHQPGYRFEFHFGFAAVSLLNTLNAFARK
jgi:hypothetical protein